jgi:cell division protein ZapA
LNSNDPLELSPFGLGSGLKPRGAMGEMRDKMGKERLVEIKVFGHVYTVKTDTDEEHIQRVARYVNEKMDEVVKNTKSVSSLNVAILTALNIADDLIKEKTKRLALLQEVEQKSKDLVEKINMNINGKETEEALITGEYSPAKQE